MVIYYKVKDKVLNLLKSKLLGKKYLGTRLSKSVWESQFSSGHWDRLYYQDERDHYLTICEFYNTYSPGKSILDVGCGQGVLYHYLQEEANIGGGYMGIDISSTAIEKAKQRFESANFMQIDFDRSKINEKFDAIIFNETLYYFDRPIEKIEECKLNNLNDGGLFIVSMCEYDGHGLIWEELEKKYEFLKLQVIKNENGQQWKVGIFKS
ncbi:MAG: class I SAM-dependent methyltransferase [Flavobacterium sp.]|nr:MAG: class I SAM-dependent methyltransferase [Flavobacterium sp.]